MKRIVKSISTALLLLCLVCLADSCKKIFHPEAEWMEYSAISSGPAIAYLYENADLYREVQFYYSGGAHQPLTVKLINLPAGLTITPETFVAVPDFTIPFHVQGIPVEEATHHIAMIVSGKNTRTDTVTWDLICARRICAQELIGHYEETGRCVPTLDSTVPHTAYFTGTVDSTMVTTRFHFDDVNIKANCSNKTLTVIPKLSTIENLTISGSGYFNDSGMVIFWHTRETYAPYTEFDCRAVYKNHTY
jgi:hypothetical protein